MICVFFPIVPVLWH